MARPPKSLLKDSHPELAKQLVDKTLLPTLSTGANAKVEWECEYGHRWFARVYNRTNAKNKTGCPVCDGKLVVVGINDLATTDPDVAMLAVDQDMTHQVTRFSNKKMRWRCAHGHEWDAPPSRLTAQGSRCPYCSGRLASPGESDLATLRPDLASELVDVSLATVLRPGSHKLVKWRCKECGYVWQALVDGRAAGHGCPRCSGRVLTQGVNDFATLHPEYVSGMVHPELATEIGQASDTKVEWRCSHNPAHTWFALPSNRLKSAVEAGCPICDNKIVVAGENDLATTHPLLAAELVDRSLGRVLPAGSGKKVEWCCEKGHVWVTTPSHRTGAQATGCPVCNPTGRSNVEEELACVIEQLVAPRQVLRNCKDILPGRMELDIVVPDSHIAIEFNGVRWHSEDLGKDRMYHRNKLRMAREAGYTLFQVWEDDWNNKRDIIIRMLATKLHAVSNISSVVEDFNGLWVERLYARNLSFDETHSHEASAFLSANHVQGRVAARHFCLRDDDGRIRALLSVRSPRNNARMRRADGVWEIQRYATCGQVVGGFSRLVKHAEETLLSEHISLREWVSFSANDVSDGTMYRVCGFEIEKELPPDYRYVGEKTGWLRRPKESFQRKNFRERDDLLWDESWTEREAAQKNGLLRVYDSGKVKWRKIVQ